VDAIVERTFELSEASGRIAVHVAGRPAHIDALARLTLCLVDAVVQKRMGGREVRTVDVAAEREYLGTDYARETAENTARGTVVPVWNRHYDELQRRYPLIVTPVTPTGRSLTLKPTARTKKNHYVPEFTNRPWADADGQVRELHNAPGGGITSRVRSYGDWGYEFFLYPQWLENDFHHVETRAAEAYRKLLAVVPLDGRERYYWIAFLIGQMLRTPKMIADLGSRLGALTRRHQRSAGSDAYSAHPEKLRRAHEMLFRTDAVFATMYRRIDARRGPCCGCPTGGRSYGPTIRS
jgi:hypothetical protein